MHHVHTEKNKAKRISHNCETPGFESILARWQEMFGREFQNDIGWAEDKVKSWSVQRSDDRTWHVERGRKRERIKFID